MTHDAEVIVGGIGDAGQGACPETDKTNNPDGGAVRVDVHKITVALPAGFVTELFVSR